MYFFKVIVCSSRSYVFAKGEMKLPHILPRSLAFLRRRLRGVLLAIVVVFGRQVLWMYLDGRRGEATHLGQLYDL